jgi:hypothetical protein
MKFFCIGVKFNLGSSAGLVWVTAHVLSPPNEPGQLALFLMASQIRLDRKTSGLQQKIHSSRGTPQINLEDINSHWPPVEDFSSETPAQREERLEQEREAKRINDEIDTQLEIEKTERRKRRPDIRIILLGA